MFSVLRHSPGYGRVSVSEPIGLVASSSSYGNVLLETGYPLGGDGSDEITATDTTDSLVGSNSTDNLIALAT